jgi:Bacterial SH3 domain
MYTGRFLNLVNFGLLCGILLMLSGCSNPQQSLFKAIESNDIDVAIEAVKEGADIHQASENGLSAIKMAIEKDDVLLLKSLFEASLELNSNPDPSVFQEIFDFAIDSGKEGIAWWFLQALVTEIDSEQNHYWIKTRDGIALFESLSINPELIAELPMGTAVTFLRYSPIKDDDYQWVEISCELGDQSFTGWIYNYRGFLSQDEAVINEDRWIDSYDGLRMRDAPGLDGSKITVIPGHAQVTLMREQGEELSIDGRSGVWSKVKWQQHAGWVFGGYLRDIENKFGIRISAFPYYAEQQRNHISSSTEMLAFVENTKVLYQEILHGFDISYITKHHGSYILVDDVITIELEQGIYGKYTGMKDDPSVGVKTVQPRTMVLKLIGKDSLGRSRFMHREEYAAISEKQMVFDEEKLQYVSTEPLSYIKYGVFHNRGK